MTSLLPIKLDNILPKIEKYSQLCNNDCLNTKCALNMSYKDGWCYPMEDIKTIHKKLYNTTNKSKKQMIININKYFKKCNGNQRCWNKQKELEDMKHLDDAFLTKGPNKKNKW